MAEIRLAKAAGELNVSTHTIVEKLKERGYAVEDKPTAKITDEMFQVVSAIFKVDKADKDEVKKLGGLSSKLKKREEPVPPVKEVEQIEVKQEKPAEVIVPEPVVEKIPEPVVEIIPEPVVEKPKPEPQPVIEVPVLEEKKPVVESKTSIGGLTITGKIDLTEKRKPTSKKPTPKTIVPEIPKIEKPSIEEKPKAIAPEVDITPKEEDPEIPRELVKAKLEKLDGLTIMGKIVLKPQPVFTKKTKEQNEAERTKRKRKTGPQKVNISTELHNRRPPFGAKPTEVKTEITQKQIQEKLKSTLNKMGSFGRGKTQKSKFKRQKRDDHREQRRDEQEQLDKELSVLKVTEFLSANELSKLMNVGVNEVITSCFSLGLMVSINQRLDAETITVVADEFGFEVEFVDAESQIDVEEEADAVEDLLPRPPIVTVMGHVDHGKTSLLDYIRSANVIAGEAGGITQHIGAYEVVLPNKEKITFLDTPGHEAFTAMRARGAKVTDIAVIVIAADDSVMPQTREAISHAQAAGVPMIFAINKIDKEGANPEKIKEALSAMNILVEDWGGKFQCQELSAKKGLNVDKLLEKILLEAELLELTANPDRRAKGTTVEARLDKGRGIMASILVQTGTLKVGDYLVAGANYAKVKALFNERNQRVEQAGPSTPVSMLGFSHAPAAGDPFLVMENESEAKELANKRQQLIREQGIRTNKHITLDEIGRRLAIGNFKELNLIVKGDVDGSVEALSDSLLKLSTAEIIVKVIHKGVGQITESDVLLASASDAIIVGFQVRPSASAKKLAETEQIDIRNYSIIYQAIDEIKSAMEGMLSPEVIEKIIGNVEVREVFKITKVGTVSGCMVTDGKVTRSGKVRVIRDGVVMHTTGIESLKRFKDDVKDVLKGFECGITLKNYNDIQAGDNFEIYEETEIARKL